MATIYKIGCKYGDSVMTLEISDSINPLPGSDTWTCEPANSLSTHNGTIGSWGTSTTYLSGGMAAPIVELHGFKKSTKVGDQGEGSNNDIEGKFPECDFTWECLEKN